MKIAWFSPLPPDRSEIANHTRRIADELHDRFDASFFSEKTDGFLDSTTGTHYWATLGQPPAELWPPLNQFDVTVYNLGNHHRHFSHTWFLSQAKPGIVVLHDLKLHHFFEGIYRERLDDQATYLRWMRRYYGQLGYEAGLAYWRQDLSIDFMAEQFPMTEWAIQGALGVVVHTEHALQTIRRVADGPVVLAPLPYHARAGGERVADQPGPVRLIIFGHLNVNRRVVEFLTALAAMPERGRFDVQIFGEMLNRREVENVVERLALRDQLTMHGYVSEDELERGLAVADLAVNLRYPSMGEASASQLRIWDHALPSLVTQTEGYAGMPADTVFFVRPEHETADIQRHLRNLLAHPERFHEAGQRGHRWLLAQHRPETYVDRVGGLCVAADALRLRHTQLSLAQRVGETIAPWTDAAPVVAREHVYAEAISQLG